MDVVAMSCKPYLMKLKPIMRVFLGEGKSLEQRMIVPLERKQT